MQARLRHTLVFLLFGLLFLPMLQQGFGLWEEKPLEGIAQQTRLPDLQGSTWLAGTFQDSMQSHLDLHFGFHNTAVRLNNQYYYSVFHTGIANAVVIGQDHYLYDQTHIDAYTGADFMGMDVVKARMQDIYVLQQMLKKKQITLVLAIAPNKATCTSKHLPIGTPDAGQSTNYKAFRTLADSLQIPVLDYVAWYKEKDRSTPYPLYPAGGIHWSQYCATMAADTFAGFISQVTKVPLKRFYYSEVEWDAPRGEDADLNRGMNLLWPLPASQMAYPKITWGTGEQKLKVLTVGDSYYFKNFTDFTGAIFEQSHFWFYFKELCINGAPKSFSNDQVDVRREIESQDVVVLYASDSHLPSMGWGFVEAALKAYRDPIWRQKEIDRLSADIRTDANWMQQIATKSAAAGVPQDTMLRWDAIWVLENSRIK